MTPSMQTVHSMGDATNSITETTSASVQTFTLPEKFRGGVVEVRAFTSDCNFSASESTTVEAGDPSATAGVLVEAGTSRFFTVPGGSRDFEYKVIAGGAGTIQIDLV